MSSDKSVLKLIVILAVVVGLIGAIYSYKYNPAVEEVTLSEERLSENTYVEIIKNVDKKSNARVIVSDRFVAELDKDSNIVVMGSDGSMYSVRNGAILVSDMVIDSNDESYSVYRIDEPEKSISSN